VIRKPWPGMLRTIWGDNARYLSTYWERYQNRYYVAGDSAHCDADGYFWIMGRIDDVLKVSGHRLGTMEIESALVSNPRVAEAAVVGKPDDIKGESVFAFVVLRGQRPKGDTSALVKELRTWVSEELGPIAKPDNIRFADNLPKTRSGKIMRRLLRAIAADQPITQDISTLENPAIVDQLRGIESPANAKVTSRKASSRAAKRKPAKTQAASKKKPSKKRVPSKPVSRKKVPKKRAGTKPRPAKRSRRRRASR
jgi:acetyl-CoA synthetase